MNYKDMLEAGRRDYDRAQSNYSHMCAATDEEIRGWQHQFEELFGAGSDTRHHEDVRQSFRDSQDRLTTLGREAHALQYAQTNIKNHLA